MTVNIFVLAAGGSLKKYKDKIMKVAKQSAKIIGKKIPILDVDIVFYDNPEYAIPHLGIGGFNQNANLIFVYLNPKFRNFKKTINEEIIKIIAHELYHSARWNAVGFRETLLKALVNEGLADHFELEITNKKPQKWDMALTAKQIDIMGKKARKEFNNKKYNHEDWFFGSKARKIPKWTGYTIGFNLVGEYLKKHPDKKSSQLFAVKRKSL